MAAVSDPVEQGIITSLSRPGHNVNGTSSQAEELLAKRLELLAVAATRTSRRVAVLSNARNPVHALSWQRLESAATAWGLRLVKIEITPADDLPAAMDKAVQAKAEALLVYPDDPLIIDARGADRSPRGEAPNTQDMHLGARVSSKPAVLVQAAARTCAAATPAATGYMEGKICNGANPAMMPLDSPTRSELVVNMKTARALGVVVPQSLLLRADEVIQ